MPNILFETIFGSKLYGTQTADSDTDYKAVYAPSLEDLTLGKVDVYSSIHVGNKDDQHAKSNNTHYEIEYYTLHKFLKHLVEGQIVAIDILYAPKHCWTKTPHNFWLTDIIDDRSKFLSKNLNKFVQYAVKQAAKYGIKGSRLNTADKFIKFFKSQDPEIRLGDIIDDVKPLLDDNAKFGEVSDPYTPLLIICGKKFLLTTKIKHLIEPLERFMEKYGKRSRMASVDKGVDKKACSHAFRAAFEVKELVLTRNLRFPLKERKLLHDIKTGKMQYLEFAPMLEDLLDEVKELVEKSDLPIEPMIDIDHLVLKYYELYDNKIR